MWWDRWFCQYSAAWGQFASKKALSVDRLLSSLELLARLDARSSDTRDELEFDWEFVAQHLCEPPYFSLGAIHNRVSRVKNVEHKTCKEVVHKIRNAIFISRR